MSTKKAGWVLAILGAALFVASLLVGYVGTGDRKIGASQLGVEVGTVLCMAGIFMTLLFPNQQLNIRQGLQWAVEKLLSLSVIVWVMVGFLIVYCAFFLFPVFFNPERSMWYFGKFLPSKTPIGLDIRAVMQYIQDWLVSGQSPYADGFIAYPPLSMVLFAPLLLIGYPGDYYLVTTLSSLLYLVSTTMVFAWARDRQGSMLALLLVGLCLFSYGFQFELERGQSNLIAFSLCLIAVYIYHSHNRFRYIAYLLFTIGVQLKIYPAILIVMFIKDWRDWKGNIKRFAGIGLLNLALLFVLGFGIFGDFLRAVGGQQAYANAWNGNHSLKGFVDQLANDGFRLFPPETIAAFQHNYGLIQGLLLAIIALCFFSVLFFCYWQNRSEPNPNLLLVGTICALVIPSISNDYKLPILTVPMALVFCTLSLPDQKLRKIASILLVLVMSVAYWSVQFPFIVKPYFLTRNFLVLFILLLAVTVLNFVVSPKPALQPVEDFNE